MQSWLTLFEAIGLPHLDVKVHIVSLESLDQKVQGARRVQKLGSPCSGRGRCCAKVMIENALSNSIVRDELRHRPSPAKGVVND